MAELFEYTDTHYPELSRSYEKAMELCGKDDTHFVIEIGMLVERIVSMVCGGFGMQLPTHFERLRLLEGLGLIGDPWLSEFHQVRELRNRVLHGKGVPADFDEFIASLYLAYAKDAVEWFELMMPYAAAAMEEHKVRQAQLAKNHNLWEYSGTYYPEIIESYQRAIQLCDENCTLFGAELGALAEHMAGLVCKWVGIGQPPGQERLRQLAAYKLLTGPYEESCRHLEELHGRVGRGEVAAAGLDALTRLFYLHCVQEAVEWFEITMPHVIATWPRPQP